MSARFALGRGVSAVAGAVVRQEAQRNDTGGFTYYDILEQIYTTGLEGRWRRARWTATYGQSFMSDNKAAGIGHVEFSRANVSGELDAGPVTLRLSA